MRSITCCMMEVAASADTVSGHPDTQVLILKHTHRTHQKSLLNLLKQLLMCSFVTSIFLYACESWALTAELQTRIHAVEMRCYHKILCISHKDHVINEEVHANIQQAIGPNENLTTTKTGKLQWYGHVSRSSGLAKTILQGTVKGGRQGRQRKRWVATSGGGQSWSLPSPGGQRRTGKNGENWL